MIRTFFMLVLACLIAPVFGQSPDLFNYQGVARNMAGSPIANQSIGVEITIRETSNSGNIIYQETHTTSTNQFGLFSVLVGAGSVVSGNLSTISWDADAHYMEVAMDETGGSNYQQMGIAQLVSVPYAKHATTVENDAVDDADADPTNEMQVLSISNDTIFLSGGGFAVLPASTGGLVHDTSRYTALSAGASAAVGATTVITADTFDLNAGDVVLLWGSASLHHSGSILVTFKIRVTPPSSSVQELVGSRTHGQNAADVRDNISAFTAYKAPSAGQYIFDIAGTNSGGSCCTASFRYPRFTVTVLGNQ